MTWFKVGDTFPFDSRVVAAGNAAAGLWARAGAWSAWQLSDGFVPNSVLKTMGKPSEIRALVEAGLWHKEEGGVRFDNWFADQPSAAEVRDKQAKRAEAGRRGGVSSGATRRSKREANAEANASRLLRTEPNPVPTRPVEVPTEPPPLPPAVAGGEAPQLALVPEPVRTPASRKRRIPENWQPSATALRWAEQNHPGWERAETVEQFRDYWLGRGDARLSWDATWRNRVAELAKSRPRGEQARRLSGSNYGPAYRNPDPTDPANRGAFDGGF